MSRNYQSPQYYQALKKRRKLAELMIFIAIPATIAAGVYFGKNRNYMMMSLLVLAFTLVPFFAVFEHRKPRARELVMISVVSSIAVVANLLCAFTVPVHAGTAVVVVSGIALGPEAGFLVGALARFVCNFFTGQGPWTPWEMSAWGIIGFSAGLAFHKVSLKNIFDEKKAEGMLEKDKSASGEMQDKISSNRKQQKMWKTSLEAVAGPLGGVILALLVAYISYILKGNQQESFWGWRLYVYGICGLILGITIQRKKLPVDNLTVPVFTFLVVFLVYGGIMNIAAMVMSNAISGEQYPISIESLKLLYLTGAPYDALHALGAAVCSFVFGESMIRKIERIRIKYGVYQ